MSVIGEDRSEFRVEDPAAPGLAVVLSWASRTDVGRRRSINEDSLVATAPLFAVADGMGGHAAGDRASAAVVARLAAAVTPGFLDLAALESALLAGAADVNALAAGVAVGAGTTVTGAGIVLDNGTPFFMVFNIGDSRVYLFERNELARVTVDHSVVQELVDAGLLTPEQAEQHPESNVITRAVGFSETPRPDVWLIPVRPGMRLLICTDGLTKELPDDRLRLHLAAGMPPGETASALIDATLAAGARDNVSVVIVDVVAAPPTTDRHSVHTVPISGGRQG